MSNFEDDLNEYVIRRGNFGDALNEYVNRSPEVVPKKSKQTQQSRNRKQGDKAEDLVEKELIARGFLQVQKMATPLKIVRTISRTKGTIRADVVYESKVTGDFHAMTKQALFVHVEVKHTEEPKLSLSAFKDHQIEAMKQVDSVGAIAIFAWVYMDEVRLCAFSELPKKGKPLSW